MNHATKTRVHVNGIRLSQYIDTIDISTTVDTVDTTVLESTAKEYMPGLVDCSVSASGFYDGAALSVDEALTSGLGTGSDVWTWFPDGDAPGAFGRGFSTIRTAHTVSETVDGGCRLAIAGQGTNGINRIQSLHARGVRTATGSSAAQDNTVSSANGAIGFIEVPAVTGSVAVKIEHSANGTTWVDLITFAAVEAASAQRIAVAGTVNRYTRVTYTLDGGESIELQAALARL